jgi:hypothetical protein
LDGSVDILAEWIVSKRTGRNPQAEDFAPGFEFAAK